MYCLYHSKKEKKLEIKTLKSNQLFMSAQCTDEVQKFNENYFTCSNRKLLKEKAVEIKKHWIEEVEKELIELKEINIKIKY